ncbi:MAG TPA: pyridoxal 5'-phosphate synthase glutaminase subunit PdxT [Desertimonas sp.]|nr:pyridoxal 5'-phosphate synthase glutaminase subunit PdxT [Desertimonas sp.]
MNAPRVGVLALQGAFAAHVERLRSLGASVGEVRTPEQLRAVDALVMPGGESTTMSNLLDSTGLYDPIAIRLEEGMPVFGTCAGMILLADKILDGRDDQQHFGQLDITVRRNGYGRQVDSFETDLVVAGHSAPFHGVFIRAPRVEAAGPDVEVLASYDGDPVLVRQGHLLAACFHPELTDDARLHAQFVDLIKEH